ncbi:MAG: DUF86 domain-containing protein [Cyanobacteria bacterium P01_C01_bin.120]
MSNLDDAIRLRHMRDAVQEIRVFITGQNREDLKNNRQLLLAVVKEIEIIGEAASRLSQTCRDCAPALPWKDIIGMRNRLVHDYFEIDVNIVWAVVSNDLPQLLPEIERLIDIVV